jgi:hypothetical protein
VAITDIVYVNKLQEFLIPQLDVVKLGFSLICVLPLEDSRTAETRSGREKMNHLKIVSKMAFPYP